ARPGGSPDDRSTRGEATAGEPGTEQGDAPRPDWLIRPAQGAPSARRSPLAARPPGARTGVHAAAVTGPMTRGVALRLRFLGSSPRVLVKGEERAPGQVNYLRGNQPAQWHTELPRYQEVVYHDLWPGVDLRLYEQASALKYEFRVRPGGRLSEIR